MSDLENIARYWLKIATFNLPHLYLGWLISNVTKIFGVRKLESQWAILQQITNLKLLMYKAREHLQQLYICIVEFKKAFDTIFHDKLWVTMMDMWYPLHLIDLLAKLYRKQLAKIKITGTLSESFKEKSPTRLCPVSVLVQHPNGDGDEGDPRWISGWTKIGGRKVTILCYAESLMISFCWPLGWIA